MANIKNDIIICNDFADGNLNLESINGSLITLCRAYSPSTHTRKDEDGLLLEFPCNPTRTRSV
jgi:hypothetical protein